MKSLTFKEYLSENGIQFQNVIDDDKETVFGHTKADYADGKLPNKRTKKQRLQDKLIAYIQWANACNR